MPLWVLSAIRSPRCLSKRRAKFSLTITAPCSVRRTLSERLSQGSRVRTVRLPVSDGASIAWLHQNGEVLRFSNGVGGTIDYTVRQLFNHNPTGLLLLSTDAPREGQSVTPDQLCEFLRDKIKHLG